MNAKSAGRCGAEMRRAVVPFLLPVRTQHTWWQMLTVRFQQIWQRLRLPRVQIQPPLAPARHKPFPQRPHQQRRQTVFTALDAAPVGLTRRQLIAHVRAVTGIGCSEKLITQWRQARQGGRERQGDKATRRWSLMGLLSCLLINSCATTTLPTAEVTLSPAPNEAATMADRATVQPSPLNPRLLRIKLTLNAPPELQVKAGQQVEAGALLSERKIARQRLLVQQRTLQTAAHHLRIQQRLANESLRQLQSLRLDLPPTTFAVEQAAIKHAETEAIAAQRAVEVQQQKLAAVAGLGALDLLHTLPTPEAPKPFVLIRQHEEAKLAQTRNQQLLALSDLALHQAKLTTAREVRAWEEQKHRVEVTRQLLAARSQQQQTAIEAARLTAQLAEIELQLVQLAAVRAPFAGTIKRIEWEDMNDEKISVVVYLAVEQ